MSTTANNQPASNPSTLSEENPIKVNTEPLSQPKPVPEVSFQKPARVEPTASASSDSKPSDSIKDTQTSKPLKPVPQPEFEEELVPVVQQAPKPAAKPKPVQKQPEFKTENKQESNRKEPQKEEATVSEDAPNNNTPPPQHSPPIFVDKTGLTYDPVVANTHDNKNGIIIGVVVGVLALLLIAAFFLYRRYRDRRARSLKEQQKAVERAAAPQTTSAEYFRPSPLNMSRKVSNVSEMFSHPELNTFHLQQIQEEEEAVQGGTSLPPQRYRYSDNSHSYHYRQESYLRGVPQMHIPVVGQHYR